MAKSGEDGRGDSADIGGESQDGPAPAIAPVTVVPIDSIQPNDWNPNVEDSITFNEVVENIRTYGFKDPLEVVEVDGIYRIIDGEHRWKAAKIIGLPELPVVIVDFPEDIQKMQTVKANVLRGKLDPVKFTRLFNELQKKYGQEKLRKLLGLAQKDALFRQLLKKVGANLPDEMKREIEKRGEKIRNVEDLAAVIQSLYAKFGGTIDRHYMLFSFGGVTHLMIKMDKPTFKKIKSMVAKCDEQGKDINEEIIRRLVG